MDEWKDGWMDGWALKWICTLKENITECFHLKSHDMVPEGRRTKEEPESTYGISKAECEPGDTQEEELLRRLSN